MKKLFLVLSLSVFCNPFANAEVDESPIGIHVVEAFKDLSVPRPEDTPQFRPIVITHSNDGTNRLFIATQQGAVYVLPNKQSAKEAKTFLDIEEAVTYRDDKNEEGLLGLTFHPNYGENGKFYVYYTSAEEPQLSIISEFKVSDNDPSKADPSSEREIMRIKQPFWNHNGGSIEFGPDGYMYVGLGDGGKGNDTLMNGQNVQTLLGSILRIDIDRKEPGKQYAIPADNPFANQKIARREIYAYGLRNVWRLSFDSQTDLLYAADVGQNLWEEINIIEKGGNYGWNFREGKHKFGPVGADPNPVFIEPIWEYDHATGKSITGGQVYRGSKVPSLNGYYLYADYVSGKFWALKYNPKTGEVEENRSVAPADTKRAYPIITFGKDQQGEVYCSDAFGKIYRFEAK